MIVIIVLIISFFERRSQKIKKDLEVKSRGLDDASSDHESIVPLVQGETMKEKDGEYDYKDKSANV